MLLIRQARIIKQDAEDINNDLLSEIDNLNFVLTSLNEELTSAKDEIKRIRSRNSALETNVVEKEEITVFLVKKLNKINPKSYLSSKKEKNYRKTSLPIL